MSANADAAPAPSSLRILTISPIDYERAWNNRDHNMVRCLASSGCRVTHLYKVLNRSPRWADMIRDTLTCRRRKTESPEARFVRVDPFFNYFAGYRVHLESRDETQARSSSARGRLVALLAPLSLLRDVFFLPCFLTAALAEGRFDACIGFGPWGALIGWVLRGLGRVRVLVYEDRDYEPGLLPDRLRRSYTAWLDRALVRRADLVVSVGQRLTRLREAQGARQRHVIPNGVDWDRFGPAREALREGSVLVYSGNLVPWSGLEVVLEAMPEILESRPEARLRVIGDGPPGYRERLVERAGALGISGQVDFLGSRPYAELPALLRGASIGLANSEPVPFRSFAYPLKVIEYMAAGLPVIGTQDTETEDILRRYDCGLAIDYTPEAFAAAVLRLLGDREEQRRMRENGIRASEGMRWETLIARERLAIEARLAETRSSESGR